MWKDYPCINSMIISQVAKPKGKKRKKLKEMKSVSQQQ